VAPKALLERSICVVMVVVFGGRWRGVWRRRANRYGTELGFGSRPRPAFTCLSLLELLLVVFELLHDGLNVFVQRFLAGFQRLLLMLDLILIHVNPRFRLTDSLLQRRDLQLLVGEFVLQSLEVTKAMRHVGIVIIPPCRDNTAPRGRRQVRNRDRQGTSRTAFSASRRP